MIDQGIGADLIRGHVGVAEGDADRPHPGVDGGLDIVFAIPDHDCRLNAGAQLLEKYFRLLRGNKAGQTAFYCCNKLYKKMSDGTESRFNDYPWRDGDGILHDTICPWNQWYYDRTPPFWHYRRGKDRVIWHRLALLEMDS